MKPRSPLQKNNIVVFPCEYTYVYPNRYIWFICIAMMICTSPQEYLYPLIQQKSIPQTSHIIILPHTHAGTQAIVKVYRGPRLCRIENRQSMKHACTCSTFHFSSLTLFAYEVICHVLSSANIFFKISLFVVVFLKELFLEYQ